MKDDILIKYEKYKDSLYKAEGTTAIIEFEEKKMMNKLRSKKSPCLGDSPLWLSTFTCPQVVADTYNRPVLLYMYNENIVAKTNEVKKHYQSQAFFPFRISKPATNQLLCF